MKEKDKIPIKNMRTSIVTIETVNRGKECWYKNKKHFLCYETNDFKLISKRKDLKEVFCVKINQVSYVRKKT
tara:strand:+ start:737 stop:952 length:216 start_codon:yes stop_codon:yes gene_type:complete